MKPRSLTHLVVALAIVFGASWLAYAELGGAGGVIVPYQGVLYDGEAPVSHEVTLRFEVWTAASGGTRCLDQAKTFTPANGAFAVTLGPVTESCMKGKDLYLQILDPDGAALGARKRVYPSVAAATSGSGDFHVGGTLSAGAIVNTGALTTNGSTTLTGGAVISGGGPRALDVNGHTETDSLFVVNDSDLGDVTAENVTVSGTLATNELELQNLSVLGQVRWDCPAGTWRVGDRCVTANRNLGGGNITYATAVDNCHSAGMALCPLDTVFMCDQLNMGNGTTGACGALTDTNEPNQWIMTSTPATENGDGFDIMCFASAYEFSIGPATTTISNYRMPCNSARAYFCCSPVNPTTY